MEKKIKRNADDQMKTKDTDFSHMLNQSFPCKKKTLSMWFIHKPSENLYTQVIIH